ncbi:MAG: phosphoribosylformylglycinamidine synthase subunit PurS [Myxococcaceae bacterium]|nr:phosphoribosylformylglycinamidine synthase subunit PurS [Myxococcaceae bacterium]
MRARIYVTLKPGVLDPAGQAVEKGLHALGFSEASQVRLGKFVELELGEVKDPTATKARLAQMCEKLLANTVVENYRVELP